MASQLTHPAEPRARDADRDRGRPARSPGALQRWPRRTGMISALLLSNAGVAPAVVADDSAESVQAMAGLQMHAQHGQYSRVQFGFRGRNTTVIQAASTTSSARPTFPRIAWGIAPYRTRIVSSRQTSSLSARSRRSTLTASPIRGGRAAGGARGAMHLGGRCCGCRTSLRHHVRHRSACAGYRTCAAFCRVSGECLLGARCRRSPLVAYGRERCLPAMSAQDRRLAVCDTLRFSFWSAELAEHEEPSHEGVAPCPPGALSCPPEHP